MGDKSFLSTYLGEDKASWKEWDATQLIKNSIDSPPIYITQGLEDEFYEIQLNEDNFLKNANTKLVTYQKVAGYNHLYKSHHLWKIIKFHKNNLNK